jgi:hypothetical protein
VAPPAGVLHLLSYFMPVISNFSWSGWWRLSGELYAQNDSIKSRFFISKKDTFSMIADVVNSENRDQDSYNRNSLDYVHSQHWLPPKVSGLL